jgi:subfamily B ATP-binding cassette protein MsbA
VPTIAQGLSAADRIFTVLDQAPVLTDAGDAQPLPREAGSVCFENVSFGYESDTLALDQAGFVAPAGKVTALVGPSGAGKSTVFALIPRFYDVRAGRVLINDCDVRSVKTAELRDAIGLVAQDAVLIDDTIAENIRIGRPGASLDDIRNAALAAAADDFIMDLPLGYDTPIGEQGAKLSGGQRQRVSIARAILKDAPILLLDEATSALDSESERQIQTALSALTKGRTTLVIAHRLSTIRNADMILVFDQGRIVESGTHEVLIDKAGLYARLHALQFPDPA